MSKKDLKPSKMSLVAFNEKYANNPEACYQFFFDAKYQTSISRSSSRCGKPLPKEETTGGWHKRCIRRFFGIDQLPIVSINNEVLEKLASENTAKGYTVPGVQKKLSLHLSRKEHQLMLTLVDYPTRFILKPQVDTFETLPECEHLIMSMAEAAGISTVPHALIEENGKFAYITKRVDRMIQKDKMKKLAMEDFCQLDLRLTQDKYRGSYERCAKIIQRYSSRKGFDMTELFMRLVFSFLVGNSDIHLKNFSLIKTDEGSGKYVLSPAYDLLCVNVIMPEDNEQFALTMNGKKNTSAVKGFPGVCGCLWH